MAPRKILDGEILCLSCKTYVAKIWATEIRDGMYAHSTEPEVGKYCNVCEGVLTRKKS